MDEKYDGKRTSEAEKDITRIQAGEPVDYVIGHTVFLGTTIDLKGYPHIPRPETEHWVSQAIADMQKGKGSVRVLDMFAGSGNVGIAVLKHMLSASVDFGEQNKTFCELIEENAAKNDIAKNRYRIFCSDLFSEIKDESRKKINPDS